MEFDVIFQDNKKQCAEQGDILGKSIYDLVRLCEEIDKNQPPKSKNLRRDKKKNSSKWNNAK